MPETNVENDPDRWYRIGKQVHEHEVRIALIERDLALLSDIRNGLSALTEKFDGHVTREDADRMKLIATSVINVIAVIIGVVLIASSKLV